MGLSKLRLYTFFMFRNKANVEKYVKTKVFDINIFWGKMDLSKVYCSAKREKTDP